MSSLDFVAIGDITTDCFIRIREASVHCEINTDKCQLCVSFGDKIPYESADVLYAVGNGANASVCAARLGLSSAVITNLGNDTIGKTSIISLKADKVITDYIGLHDNVPSNYHYVLWYEKDRTILVKHNEYPYRLPDFPAPKWIYLSSLGENSLPYHTEIVKYLRAHQEVKLAFQPGTFQMKFGTDALKDIYQRSDLFFCNVQEAQKILQTSETGIGTLLRGVRGLGPKTIIITDGPRGAYCYDGETMWFVPAFATLQDAYERTGAGDAFSSTVTVALSLGKPLGEALMWGPINAGSVIQYVGAQKGLLSREALERYLSNAPQNYRLQKVM